LKALQAYERAQQTVILTRPTHPRTPPTHPPRSSQVTGAETCAEVNECLVSSIPWTREDCKCPRCVCSNTMGGFK